jgi:uncharacterized protein (DUF433 family)
MRKENPGLVGLNELIVSTPNVMGGRAVFRNTRVPIEVLFENLADGLPLDEILDSYPSLDREDVIRVLKQAPIAIAAFRAA